MSLITQELGKRLNIKEVSTLIGLDVRTVRKYYTEFGGVRIGKRRIIFFERRVINALSKQDKDQNQIPLDRPSQSERGEKDKAVYQQTASGPMGGGRKRTVTDRATTVDPFGLID